MKTGNIGIFAHVDAGKTTLSEALLLKAGMIRVPGSVDRGTAHTDKMEVERARGISVRSTCAPLQWKNTRLNLIDTPGHSDFAAEVERSMWAMDLAVLLLSGVEGVQPQAEVLFESLLAQHIPTLVFINKMDRDTADLGAVLEGARAALHPALALYEPEELMAAIADQEEEALEAYLNGEIFPREQLLMKTARLMKKGEVFPVLSGSALKNEGVEELLDALTELIEALEEGARTEQSDAAETQAAPCGIVFALEEDAAMGRGAYVRMFSGQLRNRDTLTLKVRKGGAYSLHESEEERKITQIRDLSVEGRGTDLGMLSAGEIGIVFGLGDVTVGQILGDAELLPRPMDAGRFRAPLLMVQVQPTDPATRPALLKALTVLSAEDPLLDVQLLLGEPHLRVMGTIQLEILTEQLRSRFGLMVSFAEPEVIYRETLREETEGFIAYTMPKPCWAVIRFRMKPNPRGKGITYRSEVSPRVIKLRYQHQIEQALPMALRQGMLGWQVDDVDITLIDGSDHQWHTHPLDFIVATPMAIMDGLRNGGTQLLEPVVEMRITVPSALGGRVMSEVVAMQGETLQTETLEKRDMMVLTAQVPVRTSIDFPTRLAAFSGGRGALTMQICRYQNCLEEHSCPRAGVNPLDTAKYILAVRNALESDIY